MKTNFKMSFERMAKTFKSKESFISCLRQTSYKESDYKRMIEDSELEHQVKQKLILTANCSILITEISKETLDNLKKTTEQFMASYPIKKNRIQFLKDLKGELDLIVLNIEKNWPEIFSVNNEFEKIDEIIVKTIRNFFKMSGYLIPVFKSINDCSKINSHYLTREEVNEEMNDILVVGVNNLDRNLMKMEPDLSSFDELKSISIDSIILYSVKKIHNVIVEVLSDFDNNLLLDTGSSNKNVSFSFKINGIDTVKTSHQLAYTKSIMPDEKKIIEDLLNGTILDKGILIGKPKVFFTLLNNLYNEGYIIGTADQVSKWLAKSLLKKENMYYSPATINKYLKKGSTYILPESDPDFITMNSIK